MPYRIGSAPDGNTVVFCDPQANKVWIADLKARKITGSIDGLGSPRGVKPTARDELLAAAPDWRCLSGGDSIES